MIKNIFLVVLLYIFSCVHTYASEICNAYRDAAYQFMFTRQLGVPQVYLEEGLAESAQGMNHKLIEPLKKIIALAYEYPDYADAKVAGQAAVEFQKKIYQMCLKNEI